MNVRLEEETVLPKKVVCKERRRKRLIPSESLGWQWKVYRIMRLSHGGRARARTMSDDKDNKELGSSD